MPLPPPHKGGHPHLQETAPCEDVAWEEEVGMAPWPSERLRILYSVEKITCPADWSKGWESLQGKASFGI